MYSDDSDYDVDESSMQKRTHLTIMGAQFTVNQQQIVATEADCVLRFAHPDPNDRHYKGGFNLVKNSGQVILESLTQQFLSAGGTTANGPSLPVKFNFSDRQAWWNFVNQLDGVGYNRR